MIFLKNDAWIIKLTQVVVFSPNNITRKKMKVIFAFNCIKFSKATVSVRGTS